MAHPMGERGKHTRPRSSGSPDSLQEWWFVDTCARTFPPAWLLRRSRVRNYREQAEVSVLRWPERPTRRKSRRPPTSGQGPLPRRSAPDQDPTATPTRQVEHHLESSKTSHEPPPMPTWFSLFPPVRSA